MSAISTAPLADPSHWRPGAADSTTLWIACEHAVMQKALRPQSAADAMLCLKSTSASGAEGRADDDVRLAIVDQIIEQHPISDIVLCGHALCRPDTRGPSEGTPAAPALRPTGFVERVRQRAVRMQQARARLLEQLQSLESLPGVSSAILCGTVRVHVLFYLDESDMFIYRDDRLGGFRPLLRPIPLTKLSDTAVMLDLEPALASSF